LPDHAEWREDPQAVFMTLYGLWQRAQALGANWNEAQTEDELVKPVLDLLGWSYIPQVKNRRSGRVNRPDYALFLVDQRRLIDIQIATFDQVAEVLVANRQWLQHGLFCGKLQDAGCHRQALYFPSI
jgi:hypothetical protein